MSGGKKLKLTIEYDGSDFCGWQRQPNGTSVQELLENAVMAMCGEKCNVHGSGRTDAGVHARGQVAHTSGPFTLPDIKYINALNAHLPDKIRIVKAHYVNKDFHAQYSALEKTYRYLIVCSPVRSPFLPFYATWIKHRLDVENMVAASKHLLGEHDFTSFMAAGSSVKSTVRKIREIRIRKKSNQIAIDITANGFLRNMVRNIAGTLIKAGEKKINSAQVKDILESRDRTVAGPTAPARGLTLMRVKYKK